MSDPLTADTAAAVDAIRDALNLHQWSAARGSCWCDWTTVHPDDLSIEDQFIDHQAAAVVAALAATDDSGDTGGGAAVERVRALIEAADALEGGLGVEGIPRNLYEFRQWLRARALAGTEETR